MQIGNGNKKQADQTADPSKYPQGHFKDKPCRCCGELFKPKAPSHLYCSQDCADVGLNNRYLKRNYNTDYNNVKQMYEEQNDKCFLCGTEGFKMNPNAKKNLVVDHCHTTGKVRKLLCHNCNRALGLFKDKPDLLRKAADYLEEHK
jgi:hypothetical protein